MSELSDVPGLPPIAGPGAKLLILGNAPSAMSLALQQYYGNPRNAFWRIVGDIFGFDADAPYPVRTAALIGHGVAVWDVLKFCRRAGSLDSAVVKDTMVGNDFATFFAAHADIDRVCFTGGQRRIELPPTGGRDAPRRLSPPALHQSGAHCALRAEARRVASPPVNLLDIFGQIWQTFDDLLSVVDELTHDHDRVPDANHSSNGTCS